MKKPILPFALGVLALTFLAPGVFAERYDSRVDVSRLAADEARVYRGDRNWHGDEGRAAAEIAELNREVSQVRVRIGDSRNVGRNMRNRFHAVKEATDRLSYQYRRGNIRAWEVHRRVEEIRTQLDRIRRDLRGRSIGISGWR